MADVNLFQTTDDGDIVIENGTVELTDDLSVAAYLSLFGGNEDDNGLKDNLKQWWGNHLDEEEKYKQVSETQHALNTMQPISFNLQKVQDAATRDLAWFLDNKIASEIAVVASIPAINSIKIAIAITANGKQSEFEFTESWKA